MGNDNYYETGSNYGDPALPKASRTRLVLIILGGIIVSGCVLLILSSLFLSPKLLRNTEPAWKQKCANNLRGVALGMIQYSNENIYDPHMTELSKDHTNEEISDVYRSLIQLKYCDNAEIFICPRSNQNYRKPNETETINPRFWNWAGEENSAKPACIQSSGVDVLQNSELSYTYRRKKLRGDQGRSDDMITADKARKDSEGKGCHFDGYNVGYADGHVEFTKQTEVELLERLRKRLIIGH